ncbi:hypothetical protein UFOVP1414_24 [uncultured Caudovirales phage]|uniref:Uncharacterized protein n=1 Tax=uncultured Caudovirales phage TaxID=2100421 RepID=A0A6J5SEI9_9CAUD|nr:hypothetical protein UFOVP442_53 [uncultured Caudovirales phage]CAB4211805.1 hypothetical protein UFOVP1414_24 [uncultured Caudovirales phage]
MTFKLTKQEDGKLIMTKATAERLYISQYWLIKEDEKPMVHIEAGPFNDEQEAHWARDLGEGDRPGFVVVETRHPIYQLGEE